MKEVRAVARLRIKPGKLGEFKQLARSLVDSVRERESNRTTMYTFYLCDADPTRCLVHESFSDADAFVAHIDNNSEAVLAATDIFEVESSDISGDLPIEVIRSMSANSDPGKATYLHFGGVLAAL